MKLFVYSMRKFDELPYFENYCKKNRIVLDFTTEDPNMDNLKLAKGADVIDIITTVITKEMIDKLQNFGVKCITTRTIGYEHIDYQYAKSVGMGVVHITYSPSSVADYTIMLMLLGCRKMKYTMQRAMIQDFSLKGKMGKELRNCTVGIIGTGKIGKTVIRSLSGFGCRMYAYDKNESEEIKEYAEYVSLDKLLKSSDIITLHVPSNPETFHLIDEKAIEKMKKGVILINCSRGALLDTEALIQGLEKGKIGFAGLDVIENENGLYYYNRQGEPLHNPQLAMLRSYSNVVVTPHTAFYTDEAVANMVENSIVCAKAFIEGKKTPFEV